MQYLRVLAVMTSVLTTGPVLLEAQPFEIQMQLSEMNNAVESIDVEVAKLKRLVAAADGSKDQSKRRAQCTNNLKQIGIALHRHVRKAQELVAQDGPSARDAKIIEGYAAEFYAGSRIEFERAVKAFPLKAGAGDAEAIRRLSAAAENLRKTVEELSRRMLSAAESRGAERPRA